MEINTHYLEVKKTARYATYGQLSEKTKYFWFVLHGSDMRCEQMLYKFSDFDPEEHFVVAPEGLSRFYLKEYSGDVVAAWMTKRDRLHEIKDFSFYLSALYKQLTDDLPSSCKKTVMGFSQGGTSMYRWLHADKQEVDFLVGYSCWIPEDIDLKRAKTNFGKVKQLYTYGTEDQYLTQERIGALKAVINRNQLDILISSSVGDHRVNRENLQSIFVHSIQ